MLLGLSPFTASAQSAQPHPGGMQAIAAAESSSIGHAVPTTGTNGTTQSPSASGENTASGKGSVDGLEQLNPAQRRSYQRASASFVLFCHHWDQLLHEREANNLQHLSWRKDGGLEVATYTGYGKVESCECKESREGLPIGKISYEERNFSIVGKTIDEARHAVPKLTHEIKTLEIFSWDKGKWFY